MKGKGFRSNCPINYGLEMIGDGWSLLVVRDIIFANKHTFGEFIQSEEGIARNILSNRLNKLIEKGMIKKEDHVSDKRKDYYQLTEKGIRLVPVLIELSLWSSEQEPETADQANWIKKASLTNEELISLTHIAVNAGKSLFDVI
ncbi:transcriptional regulator, HxlR family [Amphibacillus marinus]|uniref:Transcriptional regulator, HxlR family n=1 Tax=Amphibacillus marinus TaxID=872970 RepID=A0A1H8LQA2_9BACI|nr:helix-turn-helix domain-containing protein [Amphibacillus marinus]SEO07264.1 transcriptional regulator, HxlR family [Amphibacillus marinus]